VRIVTRSVILASALAACIAATALGSTAAHASVISVKADGDPATTFSLDGKKLTIASTDPVVLSFVRGHSVSGFCAGGPSGRLPALLNGARWGKHAGSVTLRIIRLDPTDIGYCDVARVLGSGGYLRSVDFSGAQFRPGARRRLGLGPAVAPPAEVIAESELFNAFYSVNLDLEEAFPTQYGLPPKTLPSAKTLVEIIDAIRLYPSLKVLYAPTVQKIARKPGIVYVVGRGSSAKVLELAIRGLDGKLYAIHAKAGSVTFPTGSFGPA
jgi:hypothetical protein